MGTPEFDLETTVLHWDAEQRRWEQIAWDDFVGFRGVVEDSRPLSGVSGGLHYFVVCVGHEGRTVNLIPHKYLVDSDGRIGADNFVGWTREERNDYSCMMTSTTEGPGDRERMKEIRDKAGTAFHPPRESLFALVQALPMPPAQGSAAEVFLETLHSLPR